MCVKRVAMYVCHVICCTIAPIKYITFLAKAVKTSVSDKSADKLCFFIGKTCKKKFKHLVLHHIPTMKNDLFKHVTFREEQNYIPCTIISLYTIWIIDPHKKITVKTGQLVSFHYLADLFNTNGTNRNALSKQLDTYSNITTTKLITKVEK